jgi:hypothetical protein
VIGGNRSGAVDFYRLLNAHDLCRDRWALALSPGLGAPPAGTYRTQR